MIYYKFRQMIVSFLYTHGFIKYNLDSRYIKKINERGKKRLEKSAKNYFKQAG